MPAIPAPPTQIAPSAAALNGLTSAVMTPTSGNFYGTAFFNFLVFKLFE